MANVAAAQKIEIFICELPEAGSSPAVNRTLWYEASSGTWVP
jgi:hypothetical protein